tara:strand:+ start:2113 stop:2460 length:348 start_codon:yes stop_codon:yes gene_type:complete
MDFMTSVRTVFAKYADFNGRAIRSEYWWFVLFTMIVGIILSIIDVIVFSLESFGPLSSIFQLAVLIPSLAVAARRLHDIDKSGWWQLLWLIPIVGWILLIYWLATRAPEGENRYS